MGKMTAGGREVLTRNVADVQFYQSTDLMRAAIRGGYSDKAIVDSVAGAWLLFDGKGGKGRLYLDHEKEIETLNVEGVYAHEFGHVVDWDPRDGSSISASQEWHEAWLEEIYWGKEGISNYSKMSKREGFAEFARMVWGSPVPMAKIEAEFPRCLEVFRKFGLVY